MANLLFLTPEIPAACTNYKTYTTSTAITPNESDFRPFKNCLRGEKYQHYYSGYASSEHCAVYDCGIASAVPITKSANFVVLSRLDIMAAVASFSIGAATMNFFLQSSSDDSTYTTRHSITGVSTASLIGPWSNDYVSLFTATSAFRYWRQRWVKATGSDFTLKIGKVYFGTSLDIGKDPRYQIRRLQPGQTALITDGGNKYSARIKHPTYEINLNYEGLTDAQLQAFKDGVVKNRSNTPVFLYTQSFHEPTDNKQLILCNLVEWETTHRRYNWNTLTCRFIESVG